MLEVPKTSFFYKVIRIYRTCFLKGRFLEPSFLSDPKEGVTTEKWLVKYDGIDRTVYFAKLN